ncbi:MAG: hypothetical protein DWI02_10200 [Planctomycetota bacterium]|nr:MAG: hypothetical protein DWI02_10200 [Planctomycetota bacterium]
MSISLVLSVLILSVWIGCLTFGCESEFDVRWLVKSAILCKKRFACSGKAFFLILYLWSVEFRGKFCLRMFLSEMGSD